MSLIDVAKEDFVVMNKLQVDDDYGSVQRVWTEGATIKYTTDNSDPITNGTEYSGELTISATTTYKVVAVKSGFEPSEVATFTYTVA